MPGQWNGMPGSLHPATGCEALPGSEALSQSCEGGELPGAVIGWTLNDAWRGLAITPAMFKLDQCGQAGQSLQSVMATLGYW